MPVIDIDGVGKVQVGDNFLSLPPDQQHATVDEIVKSAGTVASRFGGMAQPSANADALASGLKQQAQEMTQGPAISPVQKMDVEQNNLLPAAEQATTPNVARYGGKLVSSDIQQGDDGNVYYRDPSTGKVLPTDQKSQVALRDPADGQLKLYERSPETNVSPVSGAASVLSPGLAVGAVTARPGLAAVGEIQPTASDIFSTSKPYYRAFKQEASGIDVPDQTAQGLADRIRGALDKANLIPELAPQVYSAVKILERPAASTGVDAPLTLDALQNVKRVIGRSFASPDKNVRDAAAVASGEIGKILSEVAPDAAQNLKTGDDIFSTAKAVQELQRKGDVADFRAGRAGYGGNSVNAMRQVLSPIVEKAVKGGSTGFKPDEISAMRDIVEGTTATNLLRGVGQLSPSKGGIQTLGELGTGLAATSMFGPLGAVGAAALPVAGAVANKAATFLTGQQIEQLRTLVAKRSPAYAEAVDKAVTRYQRTQADFASQPGPNKLAAYISASRMLSNGMTRDGIAISSGDLLRAIRGPMPSAADEQQNPVPGVPGQ